MKAISASDILRKSAPREFLGASFAHKSRFDLFREPSPASSHRSRLGSNTSTKRKGNDNFDDHLAPPEKKSPWLEDSTPECTTVITLSEEDEVTFAVMESNIAKVSSNCNKMTEELQRLHIEEPLRIILADLIDSVQTIQKVQESMSAKVRKSATTVVSSTAPPVSSSSYVSIVSSQKTGSGNGTQGNNNNSRKKPSGGLFAASTDDRGKFSGNPSGPAAAAKKVETAEEAKVRKFNEAIKDAERSTLCFNLNMGNKPIMNKKTIAERASLALTAMAAKTEGKNNSIPSSEAIAVIDDVTSLVTNMEFYGANTKQYKGKESDKEDDSTPTFCTVPVKYQFKDREQRVFAEKQLRQVCKVKCATPYPVVVRECIKQVIDHVRKYYPDDFIKVNVHANKFALKVSRRPKGKDLAWHDYPDLLTLPNEAYDITLKKVPPGLKMFFLPECEGDDNMVTDQESLKTPPLP
jgi:hypothetical protein